MTSLDPSDDKYAEAAHVLPRWVNFVLDNLLLSFLILAEAYLLGTLMTLGWVGDIESPHTWGTFHGIGVVLFFAAGATAAGIALRSSIAVVVSFKRHEWGFALFNLLGVFAFSIVEIWASLSERSTHLMPTPADTAVLHVLGFPTNAPISPTIVMVAVLLPFASIYYGFSQQARSRVTDLDLQDESMKMDRKILHAQKMGELRTAQMKGTAGAMRAGVKAARGDASVPFGSNGHQQ